MRAAKYRKRYFNSVSRLLFAIPASGSLLAHPSMARDQYQVLYLGGPGTAIEAVDDRYAVGFTVKATPAPHAKSYCRHAMFWSVSNGKQSEVSAGCAEISAIGNGRLVGTAYHTDATGMTHPDAMVWSFDTKRPAHLYRYGFANSWASGVSGNQVVGQAAGRATRGYLHAVVWNLARLTITDLNGNGHKESGALATDGKRHIGWATDLYGENTHAILWSGSRDTETDLHPAQFLASYGLAIDGDAQVGIGETLYSFHALLWHGRATDTLDLHPRGYLESYATGVHAGKQVGYALTSAHHFHALVWSGAASKYIDLHASVADGGLTDSYATSIDSAGNIGGYATDESGAPHAIIWHAIQSNSPKV